MILPTKYENVKENSLVIGSYIISFLKKENLSFIDIHFSLLKQKELDLDYTKLEDTLTFLFLSDIIEFDNSNNIRLTDEAQQNLHLPGKII